MALTILSLATAVGEATSFGRLVTLVSFALVLPTNCITASGAAVLLAKVTIDADREDSATFGRVTHSETKNGSRPANHSAHCGIMPDSMIGRMPPCRGMISLVPVRVRETTLLGDRLQKRPARQLTGWRSDEYGPAIAEFSRSTPI